MMLLLEEEEEWGDSFVWIESVLFDEGIVMWYRFMGFCDYPLFWTTLEGILRF